MSDQQREIQIKQASSLGPIFTIVGLGAGAVGAFMLVNLLKNKRDLVKVRFDKNNIPQYTRAQLQEFISVCCNGEKPKSGRPAKCEVYDNKRVACAWAPKVLKYMDQNNEKTFIMWRPNLLAQRLYEEMKGVAFTEAVWNVTKSVILGPLSLLVDSTPTANYSTREGLFITISKLNIDQIRWLHNWFVDHHADGDNLYEWIRGEVGVSMDIRNAATGAMERAGVGSKIVIDRNKIA